jgi:hypothetical protein
MNVINLNEQRMLGIAKRSKSRPRKPQWSKPIRFDTVNKKLKWNEVLVTLLCTQSIKPEHRAIAQNVFDTACIVKAPKFSASQAQTYNLCMALANAHMERPMVYKGMAIFRQYSALEADVFRAKIAAAKAPDQAANLQHLSSKFAASEQHLSQLAQQLHWLMGSNVNEKTKFNVNEQNGIANGAALVANTGSLVAGNAFASHKDNEPAAQVLAVASQQDQSLASPKPIVSQTVRLPNLIVDTGAAHLVAQYWPEEQEQTKLAHKSGPALLKLWEDADYKKSATWQTRLWSSLKPAANRYWKKLFADAGDANDLDLQKFLMEFKALPKNGINIGIFKMNDEHVPMLAMQEGDKVLIHFIDRAVTLKMNVELDAVGIPKKQLAKIDP